MIGAKVSKHTLQANENLPTIYIFFVYETLSHENGLKTFSHFQLLTVFIVHAFTALTDDNKQKPLMKKETFIMRTSFSPSFIIIDYYRDYSDIVRMIKCCVIG